jgi:hypothetical protein
MRSKFLVLTTLLVACASESAQPPSIMPPNGGIRPVHGVPGGQSAAGLLFGPGSSFVPNGPTAPGTASFSNAPYSEEPTSAGTGAFSITIDGQLYSATAPDTFSLPLTDENGATYLGLVGMQERPGPNGTMLIDEVVVIVPESDFAPGATVAFDGNDRMAFFASGDEMADAPSVFGAALTGSVTFTAGSLAPGGTVSATVAGDFGSIDWVPPPPPPGGTGSISDGNYDLAIQGPAEVYCEGALAGQEAAFASITAASLGLTNGPVAVANNGSGVDISGAAITSAFGASPFALDPMGDGLVAGITNENAAGPAGTTFVGKYLVFDGASASAMFVNGGAGAGYVNANNDGQCSVAFGATLTAP